MGLSKTAYQNYCEKTAFFAKGESGMFGMFGNLFTKKTYNTESLKQYVISMSLMIFQTPERVLFIRLMIGIDNIYFFYI